ncbi:AsmA family protein, partial [Candidatus Poribacteria bacterium]|nr:AsmA family protein [Candidatus Poribacteria bacterium]
MRTRNVLLILFTIIFIAFIGGGFFFLRSAYLLNKVRVALENQLEKQLKHPVTIGHLSGHLLTGLDIKQFEIADAQPGKPPPISIDEIKVRYKLLGLLRGKFLVTQLDFKTPRINALMDADGVLNLTKLVPESKPESSAKLPFQPFISHINLEKGDVRFEDEKRNLKIALSGIHSRIDGPLGQWRHTGDLEVQDGRFELNGVEKKIDTLQTQFELVENEGKLKE